MSAPDITDGGSTPQMITIEYRDNQGVNQATVDDADLVLTRRGTGTKLNVDFQSGTPIDG